MDLPLTLTILFHAHRDAVDFIQPQQILYRPSQAYNFLNRMLTILMSNSKNILLMSFDVICWNGIEATPIDLYLCDDAPHLECIAQLSSLYHHNHFHKVLGQVAY
jgi:hypothetical protein